MASRQVELFAPMKLTRRHARPAGSHRRGRARPQELVAILGKTEGKTASTTSPASTRRRTAAALGGPGLCCSARPSRNANPRSSVSAVPEGGVSARRRSASVCVAAISCVGPRRGQAPGGRRRAARASSGELNTSGRRSFWTRRSGAAGDGATRGSSQQLMFTFVQVKCPLLTGRWRRGGAQRRADDRTDEPYTSMLSPWQRFSLRCRSSRSAYRMSGAGRGGAARLGHLHSSVASASAFIELAQSSCRHGQRAAPPATASSAMR